GSTDTRPKPSVAAMGGGGNRPAIISRRNVMPSSSLAAAAETAGSAHSWARRRTSARPFPAAGGAMSELASARERTAVPRACRVGCRWGWAPPPAGLRQAGVDREVGPGHFLPGGGPVAPDHGEHLPVLGQHLHRDGADATGLRPGRQRAEQCGADALALPGVG